MKKYWFKPKIYGIGFYPISKEGWIASIIFIILILSSAYINGFLTFTQEKEIAITTKAQLRFLLDIFLLAGVFTSLFKDKLDGELQWRWRKDS